MLRTAGNTCRTTWAAAGLLIGVLLVSSVSGGTPTSPAAGAGPNAVGQVVAVQSAGSTPRNAGAGKQHGDPRKLALLIGDSQSAGAANVPGNRTWTQSALRAAGYDVQFVGTGGIGFVASNSTGSPNYPSALARGQWVLPKAVPALVVIEGGGNDATTGATDAQILHGAKGTVEALRHRYPASRMLMIGTLAGNSSPAGTRRASVDALLGSYAAENNIPFVAAGNWLAKYHVSGQMVDRVHMTQSGHAVLAAALGTRLNALHLMQPDLASAQAGLG